MENAAWNWPDYFDELDGEMKQLSNFLHYVQLRENASSEAQFLN